MDTRRRALSALARALPFDPPLMLDVPLADADTDRAGSRWVLGVVRGEWAWPAYVGEQEQGAELEGERDTRHAQLMRLAVVQNVVAAGGAAGW